MKIEHLAIWVEDLERSKSFYEKYFLAKVGEKYFNPIKQFESYFLSFEAGARLELMCMPGIVPRNHDYQKQGMGIIHFAMSVGSKENVKNLTDQLRHDGVIIISEPRTTGDGYYESVVLDPEGNRIEITV